MKLLIDNGHGIETPGKRSPDGLFLEYQCNRLIASHVTANLLDYGYDARLIVLETSDISLVERCRRVNAVCEDVGTSNVLLVSIHVNASGSDGKWHSASGWSAFTTQGITRADMLAFDLYEATRKYWSVRRFVCSMEQRSQISRRISLSFAIPNVRPCLPRICFRIAGKTWNSFRAMQEWKQSQCFISKGLSII